jgi:hypothetical protein
MENKGFNVGDEAYYFNGGLWPEKVKVTRIIARHGSYTTMTISKKHVVTGTDIVTPDYYLYKTVAETKQAIHRQVTMLLEWQEDH